MLYLGVLLSMSLASAESSVIETRTYDWRARDYHQHTLGDRHEWTDYGRHYNKVNYGHVFEWDKPGLSAMSLCFEIDQESHGQKYRHLVDDEYCPQYEMTYSWDNSIENLGSRCLKRDAQTGGQRFSRIVDNARCSRPESNFQWDASAEKCWERDGETNGQKFRRVVEKHFCPTTLDVARAFGKKDPVVEVAPALAAAPKKSGRSPASIEEAPPADPKEFWEDPEDLVEHVHHAHDKIHHR